MHTRWGPDRSSRGTCRRSPLPRPALRCRIPSRSSLSLLVSPAKKRKPRLAAGFRSPFSGGAGNRTRRRESGAGGATVPGAGSPDHARRLPQQPRPRRARRWLDEERALRLARRLQRRGGERVHPTLRRFRFSTPRRVALEVAEDVTNGVPHLRRRAGHVRVVAIGNHRPAPPHHRVEPPREPDRERAHAEREDPRPLRLDDEVEVVALDAEVDDPEAPMAPRRAERRVDDAVRALAAEIPDGLGHPERHVHGVIRADLFARGMRDRSTRVRRLAAGAMAPSANGSISHGGLTSIRQRQWPRPHSAANDNISRFKLRGRGASTAERTGTSVANAPQLSAGL